MIWQTILRLHGTSLHYCVPCMDDGWSWIWDCDETCTVWSWLSHPPQKPTVQSWYWYGVADMLVTTSCTVLAVIPILSLIADVFEMELEIFLLYNWRLHWLRCNSCFEKLSSQYFVVIILGHFAVMIQNSRLFYRVWNFFSPLLLLSIGYILITIFSRA